MSQYGCSLFAPPILQKRYSAFNTSYQKRPDGIYNFAFSQLTVPGTCETVSLPVSTMASAVNWGVVTSLSEGDIDVAVKIFSQTVELLRVEERTLSPFAQQHISINEIMTEPNVG